MAVSDAILPLAVGRAHAEIHVEHDATMRSSTVHKPTHWLDKPAKGRTVLGCHEPLRAKPQSPEQPCRRRSSGSPDHDAGARHRSHPRIRQGDQIPTAGTTRPMRADHPCQCVRRPEHHSPSPSSRLRRRVRDSEQPSNGGQYGAAKLEH
jgi:hypothetical protein